MISQATADEMAYMLEAVVGPGGTAPLGEIEGFRVAGKTGTAQRANPECNCYEGGGYVTTFVGFAPADDPQYVVAVDLERPTSSAEGGQVAAPVFADVMRYALTANGVVPSGTPASGLRAHRHPLTRAAAAAAAERSRRPVPPEVRGRGTRAGRLEPRDPDRRRVGAPACGEPPRCRSPQLADLVGDPVGGTAGDTEIRGVTLASGEVAPR